MERRLGRSGQLCSQELDLENAKFCVPGSCPNVTLEKKHLEQRDPDEVQEPPIFPEAQKPVRRRPKAKKKVIKPKARSSQILASYNPPLDLRIGTNQATEAGPLLSQTSATIASPLTPPASISSLLEKLDPLLSSVLGKHPPDGRDEDYSGNKRQQLDGHPEWQYGYGEDIRKDIFIRFRNDHPNMDLEPLYIIAIALIGFFSAKTISKLGGLFAEIRMNQYSLNESSNTASSRSAFQDYILGLWRCPRDTKEYECARKRLARFCEVFSTLAVFGIPVPNKSDINITVLFSSLPEEDEYFGCFLDELKAQRGDWLQQCCNSLKQSIYIDEDQRSYFKTATKLEKSDSTEIAKLPECKELTFQILTTFGLKFWTGWA